jgi:hypothetical protein
MDGRIGRLKKTSVRVHEGGASCRRTGSCAWFRFEKLED